MDRSRRQKVSARVNFMLVFSLLIVSCVETSPTPVATQSVAATTIPVLTFTPEIPKESVFPSTQIDARLDRLVDDIPLAGLAVGIQFKDVFYEQGYGLADISSKKPVTAQTVFKIASLTKAVTAAAILRLREEGTLNVEDPISRFIPGTPEIAKNIQVRHLLNHTSGLPDWSIDAAQEALPESFTTAQAVEYYFSTIEELDAEPGTVWSYSNVGYFLLGAILENVSGMTYDQYVRTTFFQPLGLHSIRECPAQSDFLATGYHLTDKKLEMANPSNLKLGGAAAALCSTVGDLLRWQVALTEGKVIHPESWERMITPENLSDGRPLDYGFGVSVQHSDYGAVMMHEGATAGFNSFFIYYPEQDLNIVLLSNTDGFDPTLRYITYSFISTILGTP
jgi:CubicO group peptidase (beta-lactamase class C family)